MLEQPAAARVPGIPLNAGCRSHAHWWYGWLILGVSLAIHCALLVLIPGLGDAAANTAQFSILMRISDGKAVPENAEVLWQPVQPQTQIAQAPTGQRRQDIAQGLSPRQTPPTLATRPSGTSSNAVGGGAPAAGALAGAREPSQDGGGALTTGSGAGSGGGDGSANGHYPGPDSPGSGTAPDSGTGTGLPGAAPAAPPPAPPPAMPVPKPQPKPKPAIDVKALLGGYTSEIKAAILRHKEYPAVAERLGHEGVVKVGFLIKANGELDGVNIKSSSGYDELDLAAMDAVRSAAPFEPIPAETDKDQLALSITLKFSLSS